MRTRLIVASAVVAGVLGGGAVGAVVFRPDAGSAQTGPTNTATRPPHGDDDGRPGPHGRRGMGLSAAAGALGMTEDELKAALKDDKTIAQVAEDRKVDVKTVIDAMVADATKHIDAAVADGKLTKERADELKADLTQRVTDMVNSKAPPRREHDGPGPHDGAN